MSITLGTTSGPNDAVQDGDIVSYDVFMDFSDYANGTLGGGFDIVFDSSSLQFVSLFRDPSVGHPDFSRDPDILDGLLESWAVTDFGRLPPVAILGQVVFRVLPTMGTSTQVGTQATNGIGGPFIDATVFVDTPLPVEFRLETVSRIPLPAGLWLLLSALGVLCGQQLAGRKALGPL